MVTSVMPTYGRIDIAFEKGDGPYLFTNSGERYLDFASGIATNSLGHAHPRLVETLVEQGRRLWHVSNLYNITEQQALADKLVATSFADTVFFCNSGAEALEGSVKVARRYQFHNGHPERTKILCVTESFHGRTMSMLSATDKEAYREGFGPRPAGYAHVAFGNLNEMRAVVDSETAAILVEPVQGEGGVNAATPEYLNALREIADEFDLMLIFDEVQCGMGRTDKLWAYEHSDIEPDILASAKGLGGGFPVGAVMASEKAASGMKPGLHGSTYGGNPLASAVAGKVLEIITEPGFLDGVTEIASYLQGEMQKLVARHSSVVSEVRGSGLLLGMKCEVPNLEVMTAFREHKLLSVVAGNNVIRILPPLNIEKAHVDEAIKMMDAACADLAAKAG